MSTVEDTKTQITSSSLDVDKLINKMDELIAFKLPEPIKNRVINLTKCNYCDDMFSDIESHTCQYMFIGGLGF